MKEIIRSKQNNQFKAWRKLHTSKGRKQAESYLVEGNHLVEEAIKSGAEILEIIVAEDYSGDLGLNNLDFPIRYIDSQLSNLLAQTETPQGVFARISMNKTRDRSWQGHRYLLLDKVQDPGNVGTIIRTADAANYAGVILGHGSVDLYNDKLIRSSQGSIWHIPIIEMDLSQAIDQLQTNGILVVGSALKAHALPHNQLNPEKSYGFIVGNEGQGISDQILELVDQEIYIKMPGQAESLNVAIAAGIILFTYPNDIIS